MTTVTAPGPDLQEPADEAATEDSAAAAASTFRLPHGLTSIRFGLLIGAILVGGLVALLAVNTSLAAGAIKLGGLESALARQSERQQALDLAVEGLSSPESLQNRAIALGMVPAPAPVFLDAATGEISGQLLQAQPGSAPQTGAPMVTPPEPTPDPTPTTAAPPGTPTSRNNEPSARLVMPPDPGSDGATVTRAPARLPANPEDLPDASARADDGEPVLQDPPPGDSAAIVGGER